MKKRRIELELMNALYREPMRQSKVARAIALSRQVSEKAVLQALARLRERKLIKNIDKVTNEGSEPIYKLTREGESVLENAVAQQFA